MRTYDVELVCACNQELPDLLRTTFILVADYGPFVRLREHTGHEYTNEKMHNAYSVTCPYCGTKVAIPWDDTVVVGKRHSWHSDHLAHTIKITNVQQGVVHGEMEKIGAQAIIDRKQIIDPFYFLSEPVPVKQSAEIDEQIKAMDIQISNFQRIEFFWKVVIGLLIFNAVIKLSEVFVLLSK